MGKTGSDQMHPAKWVNAAEESNGLLLLANLAETLSDDNQCHEGQNDGKKIPLELLQGRTVETGGNTSRIRLTDIKRLARAKNSQPKKKTRGSRRKGHGGKDSKDSHNLEIVVAKNV